MKQMNTSKKQNSYNTNIQLNELFKERIGRGLARGHFGEYLQGHFDDIKGDIIDRACVAVPLKSHFEYINSIKDANNNCYDLPVGESGSIAFFIPSKDEELLVEPADKLNSKKAAISTLKLLGKSNYGGVLKVITGGRISQGMGTSTSDIVASVRAVVDSFGLYIENEDIARISVESEKASDGIMYPQVTLFVTTQGKVLEDFNVAFPKVDIIGFNSDKSLKGINTLEIPARKYTYEEKKQFIVLRGAIKKAIIDNNIDLLGMVSTASCRINQRFIEKPHLEKIIKISLENKAMGVVASHSGTMLGIMFDPRNLPSKSYINNVINGIKSFGFSDIKLYRSE